MNVRRGRHLDFPTSPVREAVGLIAVGEDDGSGETQRVPWLAVTIDITLFNLVHGFEEYGPPPIGALVGAPVRHHSSLVGTIARYDHPDTAHVSWRPYVRCQPEREIQPRFTSLFPEQDIVAGLDVEIHFPTALNGKVTSEPAMGPFLMEYGLPPVMQFQVHTPATVAGSAGRGAAVTTRVGDTIVLVGMVLEMFRQQDASTLLTCYPAARFGLEPQ
jgi:hypothetical protein